MDQQTFQRHLHRPSSTVALAQLGQAEAEATVFLELPLSIEQRRDGPRSVDVRDHHNYQYVAAGALDGAPSPGGRSGQVRS